MNIIPRRKNNNPVTLRNEFDDLLERFFEPVAESALPAVFRRGSSPPVDIAETEKGWTYSFALPGLEEKDIQVQLMGQQLVVSGERKWEEEKKGKEFHRVESQYGAFQRSITLPENARTDPDAIAATYKRGMLEITLPKVEPTPAAKIPVKTG